jgi:hypothetical protein
MSTFVYTKAYQGFCRGDINWMNASVMLVDNQYIPNQDNNIVLDDIPIGARIVTGSLGGKVFSDGILDASDTTLLPPSGRIIYAAVIYDSISKRLIAYIDNAQGLPCVTTGGQVTLVWDNGTNKIINLGGQSDPNRLYKVARQKFATATLDWQDMDFGVVLVDSGYTPDFNTYEVLSDIPSGSRIASQPLQNKTVKGAGLCYADNVTFPSVSGNPITQIVVYHDTGNPATSDLVVYINQATGLPLTPTGENITLTWVNLGKGEVFRL